MNFMKFLIEESFNYTFDYHDSKPETLIERRSSNVRKQPWVDYFKGVSVGAANEDNLNAIYDKVIKVEVNPRKRKFESFLKKASNKEAKILVGIKPFASFFDKVAKRGMKVDQIHDVLRGAILLKDKEDVGKTVKFLKKKAIIYKHEFKEKGSTGEFGYYGSHHFKIEIDGMICEVQVMTRRLWTYKSPAHKYYAKYRSSGNKYDDTRDKDAAQSRRLFDRGNS